MKHFFKTESFSIELLIKVKIVDRNSLQVVGPYPAEVGDRDLIY